MFSNLQKSKNIDYFYVKNNHRRIHKKTTILGYRYRAESPAQ